MNRNVTSAVALALLTPLLTAADWLQFRGGDAGGVAADVQLPTSWNAESSENIAWKAPLTGKGVSGPIVVGNKVFVTASSGFTQDRLHVMCFDATAGQSLWERQFWATGRTICHPTSAVAAPTPASDGQRIFAFYLVQRSGLPRPGRQPALVSRAVVRLSARRQRRGHGQLAGRGR